MTSREVKEGRLAQGVDERIAYTITTTPWGSSPSSPVVKLFDVVGTTRTDVSSTCLTGAASVAGDVVTTPTVHGLTDGHLYRLEVQFTISGNVFEAYAEIQAEQ